MVYSNGCTEPVWFKFADPFFLDFEKPHGFLAYALLIPFNKSEKDINDTFDTWDEYT